MSTSQDDQIDQLVQARWRAIGLSQDDLAEILCSESSPARTEANEAAKIDAGRLANVAEMLGIAAATLHPPTAGAAQSGSGSPATESLQSLLELRMLRVFREVHDSDTKRILIELAEQIVKRQNSPPQAG